MKTLFDAITLGRLPVKNRIVRSATFESAGAELPGGGDAALAARYGALAAGGVGTILTGMMGINADARAAYSMTKLYGDGEAGFDAAFATIMDAVHAHGAKLVVQISHCGLKAEQHDTGGPPLGPSDFQVWDDPGRAMTTEEISQTVQDFAAAAVWCQKAGADGVQLHGAHGYLLSQFLSPYFNKRTDNYGGPIENRARFLLEAAKAVRAAVGPSYPVWVKINSEDLIDDGLTLEECIWVCQQLEAAGIDAIEASAGIGNGKPSSPSRVVKSEADEASFAAQGQAIAKAVGIPVIGVGGYRSPQVIDRVLNAGDIAAVSLCRPLISEPALVARWQQGNTAPARCISCNRCYAPPFGCKAFPD